MLTVTARDGSAYDIDYRDLGGNGHRLAIRMHRVPDRTTAVQPEADTWHQVNVLTPDPPCIGESLTLVLDLKTTENVPAVHRTGMLVSVVGTL